MRQQVVVEQDQIPAALQQFVQVAHLARGALLYRHHAERTMKRTAARQKTQGSVAEYRIEGILGCQRLDVRLQPQTQVHSRTTELQRRPILPPQDLEVPGGRVRLEMR